jgi:hypothetical protein
MGIVTHRDAGSLPMAAWPESFRIDLGPNWETHEGVPHGPDGPTATADARRT